MKPLIILLLSLVAIVKPSAARSVTTILAKPGEPLPEWVAPRHAWPEGVDKLLDHPSRHVVWKQNFNTDPADWTQAVFKPANHEALVEILTLFFAVESQTHFVGLDPHTSYSPPALFPLDLEDCTASFMIGSQKALDEWYASLPTNKEGHRVHEHRVLTEAPKASGPVLHIFAGNKIVDLDSIALPESAKVQAIVTAAYRESHPDDPVVAAIDRLVMEHRKPRRVEHNLNGPPSSP